MRFFGILIFVLLTLGDSLAFAQTETKIIPDDGAEMDSFGRSVSVSGSYAVFGARWDDDKGANSGSAYVYEQRDTSWAFHAKLTASDGDVGDLFGWSVSISGDFAIAGSPFDSDNGARSGSAYVFERAGTSWIERAKLTPMDGAAGDEFGWSVSISGDFAVVGAYGNDDAGTDSGSAYLFRRSGNEWNQVDKLTAVDGADSDKFGWSVSISDSLLLSGAPFNNSNGPNSGAAYAFQRQDDTWVFDEKLTASDAATNDEFGWSVSVDGHDAVVGARLKDASVDSVGAAYVYHRDTGVWTEIDKLTSSEGAQGDEFGFSVSIHGTHALVGAYRKDNNGIDSGAAYLFERQGGSWSLQTRLAASDQAAGDEFGFSVSTYGGQALVGAYAHDVNGTDSGAAYFYSFSSSGARPSFTSTPDTSAVVGERYSYQVQANGTPEISFSLLSRPSGMTIDAQTGEISWTPTAEGLFDVTVAATNDFGSDEQMFTIRVTSASESRAPILTMQPLEITDPTSFSFRALVDPRGLPTTVTFEYGVSAVDESVVTATPQPLDGEGNMLVSASVTGLMEAQPYIYRAIAENSTDRTVGPVQSFTTYQSAYRIAQDRSFASHTDTTSYQLISLPGDVNLPVDQTFTDEPGEDWLVFRDNGRPGQPDTFFERFNGSEEFTLRPGRGFWALSKKAWTVPDREVSTVGLDLAGAYGIPIHAGWNIIGSVYLGQLPWDAVLAANAITPETALPETTLLWAYSGGFVPTSVMVPYQGYYFFNDDINRTELNLPFPGMLASRGSVSASPKQNASRTLSLHILSLHITARDSLHSTAYVVIHPEASPALDRLDQFAPRDGFSSVSLRLEPAFEAAYGPLALEARPAIQEGEVFDLSLQAIPDEPLQLRVEGVSEFHPLEVFLLDHRTGKSTNLTDYDETVLYPSGRQSRYSLVLGPPSFVENALNKLVPEAFVLGQNYPNPFTHLTTIEYSIPESGSIRAEVYDVQGRVVQVLVDAVQPAGFHQTAWDGRSQQGRLIPPGVYFLQVQFENQRTVVPVVKVR